MEENKEEPKPVESVVVEEKDDVTISTKEEPEEVFVDEQKNYYLVIGLSFACGLFFGIFAGLLIAQYFF